MTRIVRPVPTPSREIPLVVGAIAASGDLEKAPAGCDVVELRLDSLGTGEKVHEFAESCPLPLLVTARGPDEGGQSEWTLKQRAEAYLSFLPYAAFLDIELRDLEECREIRQLARQRKIPVIGSFHDFETTPPLDHLLEKLDGDADIYKFALMTNSTDDVRIHLDLLKVRPSTLMSVMGMGPLGAAARPLMAKAGSVLNYGYLGSTPTAPDQWPAALLKESLSI